MIPGKIRANISKNRFFYAAGIIIIFAIKYYYSRADTNALNWILSPTSRWTGFLSGTPFQKIQDAGFINHDFRIIINSSCSGINFLIISFSTLFFSFIHYFSKTRSKFLWMPASLLLSYLFTIGINGLRIISSIYLYEADIYNGWITPERVHMFGGTIIYLISVIVLYNTFRKVLTRFKPIADKNSSLKLSASLAYTCIIPVFWYFIVTVGIPFLNMAYKNGTLKFMEHSVIIMSVCLISVLMFYLAALIKKILKSH